MINSKNTEDFDYFYDGVIHIDSPERRHFFQVTDGSEVSCEFLDYVTSLIYELDTNTLVTARDLILKHMLEIDAVNDDPTKAIGFVNQLIKLNLLPLAYIGKDIFDRAIYRINFSDQQEARLQLQSHVLGEVK